MSRKADFNEHLPSSSASARAISLPTVLVVGAGIVGASIAMHLAKQGCNVTVVEASEKVAQGVHILGAVLLSSLSAGQQEV